MLVWMYASVHAVPLVQYVYIFSVCARVSVTVCVCVRVCVCVCMCVLLNEVCQCVCASVCVCYSALCVLSFQQLHCHKSALQSDAPVTPSSLRTRKRTSLLAREYRTKRAIGTTAPQSFVSSSSEEFDPYMDLCPKLPTILSMNGLFQFRSN